MAVNVNDKIKKLSPAPRKKVEARAAVNLAKDRSGQGRQHLDALRMLFDWLVTGHVIDLNPAHDVRGPKYVVKKGKTPVLTAEEAHELLDSIETVRTREGDTDEAALIGLRDRALIGVMKEKVRADLKRYISKHTQGRPLIMPVTLEI